MKIISKFRQLLEEKLQLSTLDILYSVFFFKFIIRIFLVYFNVVYSTAANIIMLWYFLQTVSV